MVRRFVCFRFDMVQEFANIPLEHTPGPEPTVYEGIPFIWGFGEAWGMLQGYVGVLLDMELSWCKQSFKSSLWRAAKNKRKITCWMLGLWTFIFLGMGLPFFTYTGRKWQRNVVDSTDDLSSGWLVPDGKILANCKVFILLMDEIRLTSWGW